MHGASSNPSVSPNAVVSSSTAAPKAGDKAKVAREIRQEDSGNPSVQASQDPAPTRHAEEEEGGKSKYEASAVFRSRKGDRFS